MIPKPEGTSWTDDQWKAISMQDHNLLIAAAAGSGKTAVLVERIIRKISSEEHPIDVDRLMVATFTKAAADEMRQRIREALEQKLIEEPHSRHLRKQLALIHRASITTLHSFCLEVVQRYFQLIQLDPGFRIGNETEMEMLRVDTLEECFEQYYANSDPDSDFWKLVDAYSGERSDDALYKLVLDLYDYSRSHPWPEHWLKQMATTFDQQGGSVPLDDNHPWYQSLMSDIRLEISGMKDLLEEAIRRASQPGGPDAYIDTLQEDIVAIDTIDIAVHSHNWSKLYEAFQGFEFSRLKAARGDHIDKSIQEQVKQLRDQVKKQLSSVKEECFIRTPQEYAEELESIAPLMHMLVELVIYFTSQYQEAKTLKGLVDFNDLEHYCLQVLRSSDSTPDRQLPSEAAKAYQEQFAEVLLDEYQDTNTVQEAIVSLISKDKPGNRFMVGDVKQSIYRFRLAEPTLFLQKYKSYLQGDEKLAADATGRRIDLARNFRSRNEVVDGVNFIFKQMMNEAVGEVAYDEKAELVHGATYYPDSADGSVELMLIDRASSIHDEDAVDELEQEEYGEQAAEEHRDLETVQMEARLIAMQIKKMLGSESMPFQVYDKKLEGNRPATYRDIVILLRATQQWAPVMMEELRLAGIPSYADLSTGYFTAGEIEIVLSILKIIDNPLQDIPLAAVLRSPIYQLTANDLAAIRFADKQASYYECLQSFIEEPEENSALRDKLMHFMKQLEQWRTEARQGSLANLIWNIYQETGYFDLVGGMPGGPQRQANLRALYDRARQYEATSFRGLFRFLRFVERMRDSGGDLGTARALGEQEDVVRIMSIHRSKGLEFPIVFVAGLAKKFNQQDLNGPFLMHRELGFGPKLVDTQMRVSYPTLPFLAIRRRMKLELLAEEMRVLYVALTRAKEKLFLIGTLRDLDKNIQNWNTSSSGHDNDMVLPDHVLAQANSFIDWIGPAVLRHPHAATLWERLGVGDSRSAPEFSEHNSEWNISIVPADGFDEAASALSVNDEATEAAVAAAQPVSVETDAAIQDEIKQRLQWSYPYQEASEIFAKTTISEMKRMLLFDTETAYMEDEEAATHSLLSKVQEQQQGLLKRPKFMEKQLMTAAERGTVYHAVMQHISLTPELNSLHLQEDLERMFALQLISEEQLKTVQISVLESFFHSKLGQRLLHSSRIEREVPFSYGLQASDVYAHVDGEMGHETILVQGVIDCVFEDDDGIVLVDYKTDAVYGHKLDEIRERYRLQIEIYAKAIESIWNRPVKEKFLFLFDGAHILQM